MSERHVGSSLEDWLREEPQKADGKMLEVVKPGQQGKPTPSRRAERRGDHA